MIFVQPQHHHLGHGCCHGHCCCHHHHGVVVTPIYVQPIPLIPAPIIYAAPTPAFYTHQTTTAGAINRLAGRNA